MVSGGFYGGAWRPWNDGRCCSEPLIERVDKIWSEGTLAVRTNFPVVLSLLALTVAVPLLGACHTTAGVGEDVSAAGHAVTNEAKKLTP
jgi:predicted small secreted protein